MSELGNLSRLIPESAARVRQAFDCVTLGVTAWQRLGAVQAIAGSCLNGAVYGAEGVIGLVGRVVTVGYFSWFPPKECFRDAQNSLCFAVRLGMHLARGLWNAKAYP